LAFLATGCFFAGAVWAPAVAKETTRLTASNALAAVLSLKFIGLLILSIGLNRGSAHLRSKRFSSPRAPKLLEIRPCTKCFGHAEGLNYVWGQLNTGGKQLNYFRVSDSQSSMNI
jgi:hypothetical protein